MKPGYLIRNCPEVKYYFILKKKKTTTTYDFSSKVLFKLESIMEEIQDMGLEALGSNIQLVCLLPSLWP